MAIFSPSTASGYINLKSVEVAIAVAFSPCLDIRDADNTSFNSINMEMFDLFSITLQNTGAVDLTEVQLEHSPDAVAWEPDAAVEAVSYFDGLAAGGIRSLENVNNIRPFFRMMAKVAASTTTVVVTILGRVLV